MVKKKIIALFLISLVRLCLFPGDWDWMSHHLEIDLEKASHFSSPVEIDCDNDGNIFVVDVRATRVTKISADMRLQFYVGRRGQGPGEFITPYDIAVDRTGGSVWVSDQFGWKLFRYNLDGKLLLQKATPKHQPFNIACRKDGKLVVAGTGSTNLVLYDESLNPVKRFGRELKGPMEKGVTARDKTGKFLLLTIGKQDRVYAAYTFEPIIECYNSDCTLLWKVQRPWLRTDRKPVPVTPKGMGLNKDADSYHKNIFYLKNRIYISTGDQENGILAFDADTGKYLGHKKINYSIRAVTTINDRIYTIDTQTNTLHAYSQNPSLPAKEISKDKNFRFINDVDRKILPDLIGDKDKPCGSVCRCKPGECQCSSCADSCDTKKK